MVTAGPSRAPDTWQPTRYLEPNKPDNEEVLEQAAYQAAVTKQGGDNRNRRYKPRRTVDYMGPMTKWTLETKLKAVDYMATIHPNPSDLIGVSDLQHHVLDATRKYRSDLCSYYHREHMARTPRRPYVTTLCIPQSTRSVHQRVW